MYQALISVLVAATGKGEFPPGRRSVGRDGVGASLWRRHSAFSQWVQSNRTLFPMFLYPSLSGKLYLLVNKYFLWKGVTRTTERSKLLCRQEILVFVDSSILHMLLHVWNASLTKKVKLQKNFRSSEI